MEHESGAYVKEQSHKMTKIGVEKAAPSQEINVNYTDEVLGLGQLVKSKPTLLVKADVLEDNRQGTSKSTGTGSLNEAYRTSLGDLLNVKHEASELDIGPTVLQHMDIYYTKSTSNGSLSEACRTSLGDLLNVKHEASELDIGPTVLQHMDIYYTKSTSNGSLSEACRTSLGDLLNVKDEASELDIRPTVLQHMDIYCTTNQNVSAVAEENTIVDDCTEAMPCTGFNKGNTEDTLIDSAKSSGRGGRRARLHGVRGELGCARQSHLSKPSVDATSILQQVRKSPRSLVLDKNERHRSTSAKLSRVSAITKRVAASSRQPENRPEARSLVPLKKRKICTTVVDHVPGDCLNVVGAKTVTQSSGSSVKEVETPPLCDTLELPKAVDLCAEEVEELVATDKWHLNHRLQSQNLVVEPYVALVDFLDYPKAISGTYNKLSVLGSCAITAGSPVAGPSGDVASPELTVSTANTLGQAHVGIEKDTGVDVGFDIGDYVTTNMNTLSREIPDNAELEAPVRTAIMDMEEVMDADHEALLGVNNRFDWREDFSSFRGRREQFVVASPGPTEMFDSAYKAFVAIWDRDFMESIARETNRYAKQVIEMKTEKGELSAKSLLHMWTDTNVEELYVFFAVNMFMGLLQRTKLDEYWKTDSCLQMPLFRQLMSYNRYILLNKFLHFVDNFDVSQSSLHSEGTQLSSQLCKIAPVINHLNSKFRNLYVLGENIVVDESLTFFKDRLSWIQSIRTKATCFGTKSFELCDSDTGYLHKFIIYRKDSNNPEVVMPSADLGGKSTLIVLDLLKGLEHKGYRVTMDNFYNSPSLARYLKSLGFDCVGTLRANRKHVPETIAKLRQDVAKGTIVARHCGDVCVLAWKDVKVVNMISTYHDASTFVGCKAGKFLIKPVSVSDYNNAMGGVDRKDQQLSMYLLERRRGLKWYMKIFKRLMNASILNSYILCRHSWSEMDKPVLTHREFRYKLADELIKFHKVSSVARPITHSSLKRLRTDIMHVPNSIKGRNRRRCAVCTAVGQAKRVLTSCITCDVGLCLMNCWVKYHSLPDLKALSKH